MNSNVEHHSRVLARSAKEARQYSIRMKIMRSLIICLAIVILLTYIVSVLYSKYGSFTVSVNKFDGTNYSLFLSDTGKFGDEATIRLHCDDVTDITNISVNDLPRDLETRNGEHNGENYLAYTFYLKNMGKNTLTYEYYLYVANVTNDVDKAIRIRVYEDGKDVTYAQTKSNGKGAETDTSEFLTDSSVCRVRVKDFKPDDLTKFTVVIWLEGDDADCTDDLIGGMLKCDMKISVIESDSDIE